MNFFRHIWLQKITACFLLGLLGFVYAEKVFHTHSDQEIISEQKGFATKIKNNTCSICDFQIARDADLPSISEIACYSSLPIIEFATITPGFFDCTPGFITDRGPPVC